MTSEGVLDAQFQDLLSQNSYCNIPKQLVGLFSSETFLVEKVVYHLLSLHHSYRNVANLEWTVYYSITPHSIILIHCKA